MNLLEKQLAPIEKVLDTAWREPDEALHWHAYGYKAPDVQRFVDAGIVDPHTAKALDELGVRVGMVEQTREPLLKEAERGTDTPED